MLLWLAHYLQNYFHFLRVIQYLTFRAIFSALTALLIVLFLCPVLIRRLSALQFGQVVRTDGPQAHLKKTGTPTMGGSLILIALGVSVFLWSNLLNPYVWIALFVTMGFGVVGCVETAVLFECRKFDASMLNVFPGSTPSCCFQKFIALTRRSVKSVIC